ncbi:exostosin family protein [Nostoc minutum NIES-26]|uniref:Exostosin family protein n=1 Tax=Nostoc minutum NIES-26 TaxID=1844469 RepID=A0A367QV47_9NOSO|nr:glycosyltransferase family 1 protein [Dendronalium sp. ChiSLP03b]MDZ8204642.1 glycosyltransferase family 1 protein [Dendronalium sp. ChiSLP03b]RCJ27072.1 exostosin family protein [Nostoc minutum NIES-26]
MTVINALANQYYLYIRRGQKPVPWNIYDTNPPINFGLTTYFGKIFQAIEKSFQLSGLVFYVTWDEIDELPSYGQNVVVFVLGDEWYRIPKYTHKVKAVFKCIGTHPILGCNPLVKPSLLNLLTLIQFLRILVVCLPGFVNYHWHKFKNLLLGKGAITPIYDIPLGYNNSKDMLIKDIEKRLYDAYFSGSVVHVQYPLWSLKYWLGTPKTLARKLMLSSVNKFKKKNPDFKVELSITGGFRNRTVEDERSYCEIMMDTKICLVPRGTSFETTRLFEAMKYGCIVVTEALPSRWYLDGAPVIKIKDWQDLEGILGQLLKNKQLMRELHEESLNWWKNQCSEAIVAEYIVEKLYANIPLWKKHIAGVSMSLTPP